MNGVPAYPIKLSPAIRADPCNNVSRVQESEADDIGLMYMARAGYNPRQAINLWQNMEQAGGKGSIEFLSTHPAAGSRIERLQALVPRALAEYRAAGGRG